MGPLFLFVLLFFSPVFCLFYCFLFYFFIFSLFLFISSFFDFFNVFFIFFFHFSEEKVSCFLLVFLSNIFIAGVSIRV